MHGTIQTSVKSYRFCPQKQMVWTSARTPFLPFQGMSGGTNHQTLYMQHLQTGHSPEENTFNPWRFYTHEVQPWEMSAAVFCPVFFSQALPVQDTWKRQETCLVGFPKAQWVWSTSELLQNTILEHVTSWCKSASLQQRGRERSLAPITAPRRRNIPDSLWQNQRTRHRRFSEPEQEVCLYFHFTAPCWPRTRLKNTKDGVTRFTSQVVTHAWC